MTFLRCLSRRPCFPSTTTFLSRRSIQESRMADHPLAAPVSIDSLARAANIPLPAEDALSLHGPRLPFLEEGSATESTRNSYVQPTPFDSGTLLPVTKNEDYTGEGGEDHPAPPPPSSHKAKRRPLLFILLGLVALIVVVLGVMLPVYFFVIKPRNATSSQSSSSSGTNSTGGGGTSHTPPSSTDAITGGDGSTVKAGDGSTFTYNNKLGGICESMPS